MKTITIGRKPTLGEVLDYYTREDFLAFMLQMLTHYRVVTVISKTKHWEPNWERDEVKADNVADLRRFIVEKITAAFLDTSLDMRPDFYPSFHQSVQRRPDDAGRDPGRDCVFEADLPTWRDSFRDVGAAVTLMERHDVRYRHKFSGHRSLHIVIPAEHRAAGLSRQEHGETGAAHHPLEQRAGTLTCPKSRGCPTASTRIPASSACPSRAVSWRPSAPGWRTCIWSTSARRLVRGPDCARMWRTSRPSSPLPRPRKPSPTRHTSSPIRPALPR